VPSSAQPLSPRSPLLRLFDPDDEGTMIVRNLTIYTLNTPNNTSSYPRRTETSITTMWEHQVLPLSYHSFWLLTNTKVSLLRKIIYLLLGFMEKVKLQNTSHETTLITFI
jgi:hypothetical protein